MRKISGLTFILISPNSFQWDEVNLAENEADLATFTRVPIQEPKTPYRPTAEYSGPDSRSLPFNENATSELSNGTSSEWDSISVSSTSSDCFEDCCQRQFGME